MQCLECGAECQPGEKECLACKSQLPDVRVLTEEEKAHFDGMTLEQDNNKNSYQYSGNKGEPRTYIRHFQFNSGNGGFITKLLFGAGVVALLMLIALPLVLVFGTVALFGWLFLRRLR